MRRLLSTCLLLAALPGCTQLAIWALGPERIDECDGPIASIDAAKPDFTERLQVQVESTDTTAAYQVLVQKRGDRLTVIALTRFGAKAFTVVQQAGEVKVESEMRGLDPLPPINLLRDLHRWPLRTVETPADSAVRLTVDPSGDAATIVNQPCGYCTRLVRLERGE